MATRYLQYRVTRLSWRFYVAASIPFQQGANTVLPIRVFEVPMVNGQVPGFSVANYLDYKGVRSYTFTRDIVGSYVPYSPVTGKPD